MFNIENKNLGNDAFKNTKYENSIKEYTRAIEIDPKDYTFYSNRSAAYAEIKEFEKSL